MASVINPQQHAHLIDLQLKVFDAFDELDAFDGDDEERPALRERVRQTVTAKEAALYETGLVDEHGYNTVNQDLKQAARAVQRAQAADAG